MSLKLKEFTSIFTNIMKTAEKTLYPEFDSKIINFLQLLQRLKRCYCGLGLDFLNKNEVKISF